MLNVVFLECAVLCVCVCVCVYVLCVLFYLDYAKSMRNVVFLL